VVVPEVLRPWVGRDVLTRAMPAASNRVLYQGQSSHTASPGRHAGLLASGIGAGLTGLGSSGAGGDAAAGRLDLAGETAVFAWAYWRSSGGAIGWVSPAGGNRSVVNSFDRGRLVQQSWYGDEDGSNWNGQPWRRNPVQGGDWRGRSAKILKQSVSEFRGDSAARVLCTGPPEQTLRTPS
jgi:hypothetical protein